jgi:hypothetical protein
MESKKERSTQARIEAIKQIIDEDLLARIEKDTSEDADVRITAGIRLTLLEINSRSHKIV